MPLRPATMTAGDQVPKSTHFVFDAMLLCWKKQEIKIKKWTNEVTKEIEREILSTGRRRMKR